MAELLVPLSVTVLVLSPVAEGAGAFGRASAAVGVALPVSVVLDGMSGVVAADCWLLVPVSDANGAEDAVSAGLSSGVGASVAEGEGGFDDVLS